MDNIKGTRYKDEIRMGGKTLFFPVAFYINFKLLIINISWFDNLPLLGTKIARPALRAGLAILMIIHHPAN